MALTVKNPWTRQPQVSVGVDWGNSLARGLALVHTQSLGYVNLADGRALTPVGSPQIIATVQGVAISTTRAAASGVTVGTDAKYNPPEITLLSVATQTSITAATSGILLSRDDNTLGRAFVLDIHANSAWGVRYYVNGGGTPGTNELREGVTATAGRRYVAAVTHAASVAKLFVDGKLVNSSSSFATKNSATGNTQISRRTFAANTDSLTGTQALSLLWSRALSDAEIKSISANPWQIFAPLQRRIWVPGDTVVTIARPGSDITTTGWYGTPDNVTKYANIDEASASDTDYITSPPVTGTVDPITFGIKDQTGNPNTLPVGTWDVTVRANYGEGLTASQVKVTLLDSGGASVGTSAWQTVTTSYADYTLSITTTGIAARIRIEVQ